MKTIFRNTAAFLLAAITSTPAWAEICDDMAAARSGAVAQEEQEIAQQHQDMADARQATADCMTQVSNLMGQYVVSSAGLGSIGNLLNQRLSSAACNTIRQQANEALARLSSVANQAGVPGQVTSAASGAAIDQVNDAFAGRALDPAAAATQAASSASTTAGSSAASPSTWGDLANMLSNSK